MDYKLIFLFDGACPLCLREVNFLKDKDKLGHIRFIDISSKEYDPSEYKNISYKTAMNNLHGLLNNGEIITGLSVLAYSYELVGLGWVYYLVKLPLISTLFGSIYKYWAKYRLLITGRNNEYKLCSSSCETIK
tara:strand:- start:78 stop:476 length:399 start_codon:yes stop_codon:yes gene_type:complete